MNALPAQVLYVMELLQNQEEGRACFSSISEFLLTHPVLSFGIQVVTRCRLRHTEVLPAEEENDSLGAGELLRVRVVPWYVGSTKTQGQGLSHPHCPCRWEPRSWRHRVCSWCAHQALLRAY